MAWIRQSLAALSLLLASLADASDTIQAASPQIDTMTHDVRDTADVSAFVDRFFASLPPSDRVPRAAFVLVDRAGIRIARGFGTTAGGDPVDAARTIFRAASNSKLVTATAVMQLVDAKLWQVGDDVNRYLPAAARLDTRFERPVTIAHLLTHTGGFEDRFAGAVTVPERRLSLADYFARRSPRRVTPPGTEASYSNVGFALLGYLVEVRSGEPFTTYADRHIFAPLEMTRSSFAQPPPAAWAKDIAGGPPGRREIVFNPYPAATLVATPTDIGRFIAAHLNEGLLGKKRILSLGIAREMHATHWRAQPEAPGVAYGFFEGFEHGHRTLYHTGDSGDHSVVFLLPDEGVGFYLVYSGTDEQVAVRERFTRLFLARYFAGAAPRTAVAASAVPGHELAGRYRSTQFSRSNYEKVKAIFSQATVRDIGDDTLVVQPPGGGVPVRLTRVAPLTFRGDNGEVVAFRRQPGARIEGFTLGGFIWDPSSWDRIGLLEDGRLHVALFAAVIVILATRVMIWPILAVASRLRRRPPATMIPAERFWWRWSALVSIVTLLAPIAALATALLSFAHPVVAIPRAAAVLSTMLAVVLASGLALIPIATQSWRRRYWSTGRRVHLSAMALAALVATPLFFYWKLVSLP